MRSKPHVPTCSVVEEAGPAWENNSHRRLWDHSQLLRTQEENMRGEYSPSPPRFPLPLLPHTHLHTHADSHSETTVLKDSENIMFCVCSPWSFWMNNFPFQGQEWEFKDVSRLESLSKNLKYAEKFKRSYIKSKKHDLEEKTVSRKNPHTLLRVGCATFPTSTEEATLSPEVCVCSWVWFYSCLLCAMGAGSVVIFLSLLPCEEHLASVEKVAE